MKNCKRCYKKNLQFNKLTEFHRSIHAQQDVITFNISVNHLIRMKEV